MKNSSAEKTLNFSIARRLEGVAQILEAQGGNPFRVQACRPPLGRCVGCDVRPNKSSSKKGNQACASCLVSGKRWRDQLQHY